MPKKKFGKAKMKKMWCSFRPWFSSGLWHFALINKNWKNGWNRNSNGKMLNAFLAIHGRCKFIIFSARTNSEFIRADIDTFADGTLSREGKKHCKTQYKINIFHIHTIKLQLTSGEPQLPPYIYMCVYTPYIIGLDPYDWWLTCLVRKPIQWSSRAKVLVNGPSDGVM